MSAEEPADGPRPRRTLSPAAQAAIARYKRTLGNVADPQGDDGSPARQRSDLERHLVDRPPHWAPPRRDRPSTGGAPAQGDRGPRGDDRPTGAGSARD